MLKLLFLLKYFYKKRNIQVNMYTESYLYVYNFYAVIFPGGNKYPFELLMYQFLKFYGRLP